MLAVAVMLAALLSATPGVTRAEGTSNWQYTVVGFASQSVKDMDVYQSSDGEHFTLLQKAAYRPPTGVVRDPSIFRHSDGQYYVAYTTGETSIGLARSADRVHWTFLKNIPLPLCCAFLPGTGDGKGPRLPFQTGSAGFADGPSLSPFTTKAWAPEWFVDNGSVNLVVSLSTGGGFVPYLITALDASLQNWSWPRTIAGLGADRIDTTIVKVGSTFHAFTKNETKKVIEHAVAPSLAGPYTFLPPGDWGKLVEGPAVAQLPDGRWRLYFDAYAAGTYQYSDSDDGMQTWSKPKVLDDLSGKVRHFGILREAA